MRHRPEVHRLQWHGNAFFRQKHPDPAGIGRPPPVIEFHVRPLMPGCGVRPSIDPNLAPTAVLGAPDICTGCLKSTTNSLFKKDLFRMPVSAFRNRGSKRALKDFARVLHRPWGVAPKNHDCDDRPT